MSSHSAKKIEDIEVLRAIAVLYTVFEHRHILLFWQAAQSQVLNRYLTFREGVDIFFVISGFVIARGLLPLIAECPNFRVFFRVAINFWIKRIYRIMPSAWLWAFIIFGYGATSQTIQGDTNQLLSALFNVMNINIFLCKGMLSNNCGHLMIGHYWSLSLEEQFYLLIPFVFLMRRNRMIWLLVGLCASQMLLHRAVSGLLWFIRSDGLLLGVLMAITLDSPTRRKFEPRFLSNNNIRRYVVLISLLLLLSFIGAMEARRIIWCGAGVISLIAASLVWIASFDQSYILPKGLLKKVLVWLGARSFAIYIIHPLVFAFTRDTWVRSLPAGTVFDSYYILPFCVCAAIVILTISDLNYRYIEIPLRNRGAKRAQRWLQPKNVVTPLNSSPQSSASAA